MENLKRMRGRHTHTHTHTHSLSLSQREKERPLNFHHEIDGSGKVNFKMRKLSLKQEHSIKLARLLRVGAKNIIYVFGILSGAGVLGYVLQCRGAQVCGCGALVVGVRVKMSWDPENSLLPGFIGKK